MKPKHYAVKSNTSRTLQATDMWRKMLSMLFETGHPWITFKDASAISLTAAACRRCALFNLFFRNHVEHQQRTKEQQSVTSVQSKIWFWRHLKKTALTVPGSLTMTS
jgi:ribonucleotide reductase alpha subunit